MYWVIALLICIVCVALWSWLIITPWFFVLTRLKNMGYTVSRRSFQGLHENLGWFVSIPLLIFLPIGALSDILFNWTWGTVIFRERPRELFFTGRVKRHMKGFKDQTITQLHNAEDWRKRINEIQPGHI